MKSFLLGLICVLVLVLLVAAPANCASYSVYKSGVLIEGMIAKGDYRKLLAFIRDGNFYRFMNIIYIDSNGGDVVEAMRIGNFVNKLYGNTIVESNGKCLSACVAIWAGGVSRTLGGTGQLGLHRISMSRDEISVSKNEKAIKPIAENLESYLLKMGFPRRIVDKISETSSANIFLIDNRWLANEDLLDAVSYHPIFIDIAQKKCGTLSIEQMGHISKAELLKWTQCVDDERYRNMNVDENEWRPLLDEVPPIRKY